MYSAVSKYIAFYQEYRAVFEMATVTLVCKSLGDSNSIIDADESTDKDTKRTAVTLIMNEVKKYNTHLARVCAQRSLRLLAPHHPM